MAQLTIILLSPCATSFQASSINVICFRNSPRDATSICRAQERGLGTKKNNQWYFFNRNFSITEIFSIHGYFEVTLQTWLNVHYGTAFGGEFPMQLPIAVSNY